MAKETAKVSEMGLVRAMVGYFRIARRQEQEAEAGKYKTQITKRRKLRKAAET